jgi:hypothetical protein
VSASIACWLCCCVVSSWRRSCSTSRRKASGSHRATPSLPLAPVPVGRQSRHSASRPPGSPNDFSPPIARTGMVSLVRWKTLLSSTSCARAVNRANPGFPSSRARRQDQAARPFAIDYPAHLTQHLGPPASDARRLALRARGAGPCGRTLRPEQSAEPVYLWVDSVYPLAASPPELLRGGLDARRELGPEASPLPRVRNCEWLSGD